MYFFMSDDGSQNTFDYQPTPDTLESKKKRLLIMLLVRNQTEDTHLNLHHYVLFSCIA